MRLARLLGVITAATVLLAASSIAQTGSCGYWDGGAVGGVGGNNTLASYFDTQEHVPGGDHFMNAWHDGRCSYVNVYPQVNSQCIATVYATDTPKAGEEGALAYPYSKTTHIYNTSTAGSSASNNGSVVTEASAGIGVADCTTGSCSVSITIGATGVMSETINGAAQALWQAKDTYYAYCPSERAYPVTPIIIDTANEGFQLTDLAGGVVTDIVSPGHPVPLAWTKPGSHNAFLWLGGQLFGNSTPQPPSDDPNGFRALAVYDSNGDGVIDAKDPVFASLRLWIDANHDGVAQSGELFTLPSLGVYSISLQYVQDKYTDGNSNYFRYRGHLRSAAAPNVDRTIYDVFLSTK